MPEKRKSGVDVTGYPNYIAPYNLEKLSTRHHPLGKMPVYPKNGEPEVWFEEKMASQRYKYIVDEWCRVSGDENKFSVPEPGFAIMMMLGMIGGQMLMLEDGNRPQLEKIAEEVVREYFNLDETEVLFDLEILDPSKGEKPADHFDFKKDGPKVEIDDPKFDPDFRDEIVRRRMTNAIMQGASLKGHFMFHLAGEKLNNLIPGVTEIYSKAMILNDLLYYYKDDIQFSSDCEKEMQAGMNEVDYSGEVPVIRVKAFSMTLLVHEMVLGVVEMLSSHGLPKDPVIAQEVLDLCDTIMNEFWDIRLGPILWEKFYALLDIDDHEYLKHVIVGINQLETPEYLGFLKSMLADDPEAKKLVDTIVRNKKYEIAEYELSKEDSDDDDNLPKIDWGSLGM